MTCPSFARLLALNILLAFAIESPAQCPTPDSTTPRRLNQVFVKVIVPVTSRTPKQDGPVVESWVAEQLKQLGAPKYFAVTDWVPVFDALLTENDEVWDGRLQGKHPYCPVGGDIPERKNGRLLVSVGGFLPFAGIEANITLRDEPGSRAVGAVQPHDVDRRPLKVKALERLPYVAVLITPPPKKGEALTKDQAEVESR